MTNREACLDPPPSRMLGSFPMGRPKMDRYPQRLEQGDFCLRPMTRSDLPAVSQQLGALETARWLAAVPHPFLQSDAEVFWRHAMDPAQRVRIIECGGDVAGCLGLGASVWFWLEPAQRGRGLMQRVLRAAISCHFAATLAPPLIATCRRDNQSSAGVLAVTGFARAPASRRMFFQATHAAQDCHDYVMTAGQWHLLNPPRLEACGLILRPVRQQDAPAAVRMLPFAATARPAIWPSPEDMHGFIERHRCRSPLCGLFALEDEMRCLIALALIDREASAFSLLCPEPRNRDRCEDAIRQVLGVPNGHGAGS
ncbi:GNAT family protein (plasmid) [Salipiger sp. H15]|uniref:GNAT family protein n=1 Tax=Alloyangia sp. H15 TaxID=3029062 RepID=A0AAU8ATI1_9RHOB